MINPLRQSKIKIDKKIERELKITLCKNCNCMTKTINNKCGKCGKIK